MGGILPSGFRQAEVMDFSELTIVICSYKQKEVLTRCLQSIAYYHPSDNLKMLIVENSGDDDICNWLKMNDVPYWKNDKVPTTHSPSLSYALKNLVKTKYALVMDSDVILKQRIDNLYYAITENSVHLMGELQGSRGGYNLYPRIYPAFCFIDVETVNNLGIEFHDQKRIDETNSNGFFEHVPIQIPRDGKYLDCGSSLLLDCEEAGLNVVDLVSIRDYFFTVESLSWSEASGIPGYVDLGKARRHEFFKASEEYETVELRGVFANYE